jgi:hypothetical protein
MVSSLEMERRTRTLSGLSSNALISRRYDYFIAHSPLVVLRVYRLGVHGDLGEEFVKQAKESWIARSKSLLEEIGSCGAKDDVSI